MEYETLLNKLSAKMSMVNKNTKDKITKTSEISNFETDDISKMLNKIELEVQRQGGH